MQIHLRRIARESSEEIVVECDCRNLINFWVLAGAVWLMHGAWIFRDTLFQKASSGAALSAPTLAIWTLSAIVIGASVLWVAFGRRVATFAADELRVRSIIGPLRMGGARAYPLGDICDIRLWFQGVNDRGWKTTNRSIVFDYRDRRVVLFSHLPENAADTLLQYTRLHALAATPSLTHPPFRADASKR